MAMLNNFIDHKDGYARADHVVNIAQNGSGRSANDSAGSSRQRLCWRGAILLCPRPADSAAHAK
jgi:hypothetical protein